MEDFLLSINNTIQSDLTHNIPVDSIREPILYAIEGGKRWRPLIFLAVFQTSTVSIDRYPCLKKLYLFLEYVHNASLLLDDMPIMDNDDYRRDRFSVHKKYGEATCKLCSLQLLLLAQKQYDDCILQLKTEGFFYNEQHYIEVHNIIANKIYQNLGMTGLCYGQFMDLNLNKNSSPSNYINMVHYKTSSLFVLSFLLGYVFSRKTTSNIDSIEKIGRHFGLIYQVLDDLEDYEKDLLKHNNNVLLFYSKQEIISIIKENYRSMIDLLNKLKLGCSHIEAIVSVLKEKWLKTKIILYNK